MKTKISLPVLIMITMTFLSGFRSPGEKEAVGTVLGAGVGGVIGGQFGTGGGAVVGASVGAVVGGIAGNALGRRVDRSETRAAANAFARASRAPIGEVVYWHNGRTGHWGSYIPIRDGHSRYGNYCREYATAANINGRVERLYGVACRDPNGTWYNAGDPY